MSRPRIIFVNRFFYPDLSATSQMLTDLAFGLGSLDMPVTVVTSSQLYGDPRATLGNREEVRGVEIVRVRGSRFGRDQLLGRAIDYLSFYLAAIWTLLRVVGRGDVVVAKTDPPMLSVPCWFVARIKRARLVTWLQDLFPEVAIRLGIKLPAALSGMLASIRDQSLRGADLNVVIGERMSARVAALGVSRDRIRVIHNWSDADRIKPLDAEQNPLRCEWGLSDSFVVGYSGNFGRAHDFDTLLAVIQALDDDDGIRFLFIGGGAHAQRLQAMLDKRLVGNVVLKPYQPREKLIFSLGVPDLHLVTLLPDLEGLIVPSKLYGIMAAGRPTLNVGDPGGEVGSLLTSKSCGFSVQPGQVDEMASLIRRLSSAVEERRDLGKNARAAFEQGYSDTVALKKWQDAIESLGDSPSSR